MNRYRMWHAYTVMFLLGFWLAGCEESPIGTSTIDPGSFTAIQGRVRLDVEDDPAGVYIWLEGTPISTYTDQTGRFTIQLSSVAGTDLPMAGAFRLFFFLANYRLEYASILIRNGQFLYKNGDVDAQGRVTRPKTLRKTLQVKVSVSPDSIAQHVQQNIRIRLSLAATDDSVTVIFPKMAGNFLGAVLFHHLETDSVYSEISDIDLQNAITQKIGQEEQHWTVDFEYFPGMFPTGRYRIIPYFIIRQDSLPGGLLESIDPQVEQFGPAYIKYPIKRREAVLVIRPGQ